MLLRSRSVLTPITATVKSTQYCSCRPKAAVKLLLQQWIAIRRFNTHSLNSLHTSMWNGFSTTSTRFVDTSTSSSLAKSTTEKDGASKDTHSSEQNGTDNHDDISSALTPAEHENITSNESLHVQRMLFESIKDKPKESISSNNTIINNVHRSHVKPSSSASSSTGNAANADEFHKLDIRVARILTANKHAEADTLYVEQVDVGDAEEMAQGGRVIVSGLVPYMTAASLENRLVIVIKNMKPVKLRGVISRGMLLCAEREGKVELLEPPPNSEPGDCVFAQQYDQGHPELVLNPKKKVWDRIAPHLTTDEHGIAKYRGETLRTQHGPIKAPHLFNGIIR